eukprot:TRINITY_DN3227_c1_g3_i2.p1 TRINITY_DN3227_c1_g3~~TRINITY_DN3227_c1_g3_i2.p1  ORF type:complete len:467 (+),score=78.59 TRINITY_DN3227_c1_g3_i2:44-1444(+)
MPRARGSRNGMTSTQIQIVLLFAIAMFLYGASLAGMMMSDVEKKRSPNSKKEVQPTFLSKEDLERVCEERRVENRKSERKIYYIPSGYVVEAYIKNSFRNLGYEEVFDYEKATFIVGKRPGSWLDWRFCLDTMKHNHIPGQIWLIQKDKLVLSLRSEARRGHVSARTGLTGDDFLKHTYLVNDQMECNELMTLTRDRTLTNSEMRKPRYIQKALKGGHNGKGLIILDGTDMEQLLKKYTKTGFCATEKVLIQEFLQNPLLIDGRTFNLRLYFIVLRVKPALVVYHDGYARLTRGKFVSNSTDLKNFVSNSEKVWKGGNSEQAKHFMTLPEIENHLKENDLVPRDADYLNKILRPKFMAIFAHLFESAKDKFSTDSPYFGVFGPDLTLDDNLNPWVFEVNFSPELSRFLPIDLMPDMYSDLIRAQETLLQDNNANWDALTQVMTSPHNMHVIVDEQQDFVAATPKDY